jgi:hypothetical protein
MKRHDRFLGILHRNSLTTEKSMLHTIPIGRQKMKSTVLKNASSSQWIMT